MIFLSEEEVTGAQGSWGFGKGAKPPSRVQGRILLVRKG